jgi:hypothetical protein
VDGTEEEETRSTAPLRANKTHWKSFSGVSKQKVCAPDARLVMMQCFASVALASFTTGASALSFSAVSVELFFHCQSLRVNARLHSSRSGRSYRRTTHFATRNGRKKEQGKKGLTKRSLTRRLRSLWLKIACRADRWLCLLFVQCSQLSCINRPGMAATTIYLATLYDSKGDASLHQRAAFSKKQWAEQWLRQTITADGNAAHASSSLIDSSFLQHVQQRGVTYDITEMKVDVACFHQTRHGKCPKCPCVLLAFVAVDFGAGMQGTAYTCVKCQHKFIA